MPKLIDEQCNGCGICEETCQQNAIQMIENKPVVDNDLCIKCGECVQACPEQALLGKPQPA